jgi:dTMP kinase
VLTTREPGGSPFAERVRAFLFETGKPAGTALAEALLFNAARADHLDSQIRPALERGDWVICDRFMDSTRAYQGAGGALGDAIIDQLEMLVVGASRPDLTIILDLDPAVGLERARVRQQATQSGPIERDPFEARTLAFHTRLRDGFLAIASREPQRCAVIDATGPVDTIAAEVHQIVTQRLGVR